MTRHALSGILLVTLLGIASAALAETMQGRTIVFDQNARTILILPNKSGDMRSTDYVLPAVSFALPADSAAIDVPPVAGGRMRLDLEKNFVRIYNPATAAYEEIPIKILNIVKDITAEHELVKGKSFPVIDREKKTITEWSPRQGLVATFTADDKYLMMPPGTWVAGNEVLIHYATPGKADRIENLTRKKP
ncbi:MAG: DUF4881 domain-containing protein [Deltaproteobacteria bacterium]|jgi:hypothetical protein|nr:DUF4881 domain-containing protein [Deltaproteobacteria bacterium]